MKIKTIKQNELTGECWLVQVWGLDKCKTCEYFRKKDCGGKDIRKSGHNNKGLLVPLSA